MKADHLLKEAGLSMGLPNLQFDSRGCARLVFDGKVAVNFENDPDAGAIQVYSVLGRVAAHGREATFRQLLQGNLFGAETDGSALAFDTLTDEIVLCRRVDPDRHDAASLGRMIEGFVSCAEAWIERLGKAPQADGARSAHGGEMSAAFIRA